MNGYISSLQQEILSTVYYYHNRIKNIDLYTIGCELSEWDGERIVENILSDSKMNAVILNTCAVTKSAQKASELMAHILSKIYQGRRFYITGCGVDFNKSYYESYGICLKNNEKFSHSCYSNSDFAPDNNFKHHVGNQENGIIKIQDGCHFKCSYCIINQLRNNPYSLSYKDISNQVKHYLEEGKPDIELIGTEICWYSSDGLRISSLCRKLLEDFPGIRQISLGAVDPASKEVEKIIDLAREYPTKMSNVITLSAQSASDEILKKMKRRHNVQRLRDLVRYAGNDIYFSWHIIPGFPGETKELFEETMNNLREMKPVYIHAMGFSPRKGTPAYEMQQNNSQEEINKREDILLDFIEEYRKSPDYPKVSIGLEPGSDDIYEHRMKYFPIMIYTNNFISIDEVGNRFRNILNIKIDILNDQDVCKIFYILNPEYSYENITLYSEIELNDIDRLEVYAKLLTFTFGLKIVIGIKPTEDLIKKIINNEFNIKDFIVRKGTYIRWLPFSTSKKLFLEFISYLEKNDLYDLNYLLKDFKESNNITESKLLDSYIKLKG